MSVTSKETRETRETKPCGSCGAPVYWLRHRRTGKPAPINAEPDPKGNIVIDLATGTYTLLPLDDRWQRAGFAELDPPDPQTLRTSHFMTCPQAKSWAQRGGQRDTTPKPAMPTRHGYCARDGCNHEQTVYRWLSHWYCAQHLPPMGQRALRHMQREGKASEQEERQP